MDVGIDKKSPVKIYRFKISNKDLYQQMIYFAEKNQLLGKEDLKEHYEKWTEFPEISAMIRQEEKILKVNGYDLTKTNISQKIFKSIKYYHIKHLKKGSVEKDNPEVNLKNQDHPPKKEFAISKELLENMKIILQESRGLKPSKYYENFVLQNEELINREKQRIQLSEDEENTSIFDYKLKKMMKNQYYMMFQKNET